MNIASRLRLAFDRFDSEASTLPDPKMSARVNQLRKLLTPKQWDELIALGLLRLADDVWDSENRMDDTEARGGLFRDDQAVSLGYGRYVSRQALDADLCIKRMIHIGSQYDKLEYEAELQWLRERYAELVGESARRAHKIFGLPVVKYEAELEVIHDRDGNVVQVGTDHVPFVRLPDGTLFKVSDDAALEELCRVLDTLDNTADRERGQ